MLRSMGQSSIRGIFKSCPLCPSGHKIIPPINTRLLSWKAFDGNLRKLQWATFISFTGITIGGALYMRHDLKEDEKRRTKSMGRPSIGGDFTLVDHNGKPCSLADFKGKWVLLYFGFCRCPDICPEQLEKVVEISDRVAFLKKSKEPLVPVFVTVDAERDTPEVLSEYIKEFSPNLIGLTGTKEQIDQMAKLYRIYYSAGPKDVEGDYIVDHTVVMYLLDPNGHFNNFYGQTKSAADTTRDILTRMAEFSR